jgi:oligosaccharyltransferase complex subunit beta
VFLFTGNV